MGRLDKMRPNHQNFTYSSIIFSFVLCLRIVVAGFLKTDNDYNSRLYELVEDGLITMYVEEKGRDYIQNMSKDKSVYSSLSKYDSLHMSI